MRIVLRHLLLEFAIAAGAVFLGIAVMWIAADALLHIDDLASQPLAIGLREIALRSYPALPIAVPIACVTGAVISLGRAARNRELTAIQTGGIRLQAALLPIVGASLLLAFALAMLEDRVLLPARVQLELGRSAAEGGELRRPEHLLDRYWYASGISIFSAGGYNPERHALRDVTVFLFDEARAIRQRIDARRATNLDGDTWEIRDATVLEFAPEGGIARRKVAALRLDLGITSGEMDRAAQPPSSTTLHQLAVQMRKHADDSVELARLELAWHSRLAQPFGLVIVVLLALPFAVGDSLRGESLPRALLRSLVAAAAFWLAWTLALLAARSPALPAAVPIWGVVLGALALASLRFRRIQE